MKYFINYLSAFFIARALMTAFDYASMQKDEGIVESVDNNIITKVKEAILENPALNPVEINVETIKMTV